MPRFFPSLSFGWTFYGVLIAFLVVAAYIDARRMIIPKWVSLSILTLGVIFNLARGAWLGDQGVKVWLFEPNGLWLGAADGFLFALAGFLMGFGIFFVMWILGVCGGGDLKLFAALSAWVGVGPQYLLFWILALSTVILFVLSLGHAILRFVAPSPQATPPARTDKKSNGKPARDPRRARGWTYALPLALATAFVLLWVFRDDLNVFHGLRFQS
jgi:Flp pilus assembly protein protease CpaA